MIQDPCVGRTFWFEYHCYEGHDSSDAQAWYRSHEQVTVVGITEPGYGETLAERAENGESRVYRARWGDGFEYDVFEDELLDGPEQFQRPDPPKC